MMSAQTCLTVTSPTKPNPTLPTCPAPVYDDEHMGDHVALVVHFTNTPSEHAPGGELGAAAWLSAEGWSRHPHGDACLAVAGADPNISGAGGCCMAWRSWGCGRSQDAACAGNATVLVRC